MELARISNVQIARGTSAGAADNLIAGSLTKAAAGSVAAHFDLGVAYSTGSHGAECDLIEAHKWFNLAASQGHEEAVFCRAEVSGEMTAREIAEAQRRAREGCARGTARRREAAGQPFLKGVRWPRNRLSCATPSRSRCR